MVIFNPCFAAKNPHPEEPGYAVWSVPSNQLSAVKEYLAYLKPEVNQYLSRQWDLGGGCEMGLDIHHSGLLINVGGDLSKTLDVRAEKACWLTAPFRKLPDGIGAMKLEIDFNPDYEGVEPEPRDPEYGSGWYESWLQYGPNPVPFLFVLSDKQLDLSFEVPPRLKAAIEQIRQGKYDEVADYFGSESNAHSIPFIVSKNIFMALSVDFSGLKKDKRLRVKDTLSRIPMEWLPGVKNPAEWRRLCTRVSGDTAQRDGCDISCLEWDKTLSSDLADLLSVVINVLQPA